MKTPRRPRLIVMQKFVKMTRYIEDITMLFLFVFCRHSPFRQHRTKDKHEIDRMTMTMVGYINIKTVANFKSVWFQI